MLRLTIICLVFITTPGWAQTEINWETLSDVTFTRKFFVEVNQYVWYPEFGESVKALDGKEVALKGFVLPMAPDEGLYILSQSNYASCFFCGGGGPETIVELQLKPGHREFSMDEVVTMKGKLKLNQNDIDFANYILEEAEEQKE